MDRLTTTERFSVSVLAALLGLGLGAILHADALASIGLVALVGILLGIGLAATARSRR
jgi:predicted exporter